MPSYTGTFADSPHRIDRLCVPGVRMAAQGHRVRRPRPAAVSGQEDGFGADGQGLTGYGRSMKSRKRSRSSAGTSGVGPADCMSPTPAANTTSDRSAASSALESAVVKGLPDGAQHPPVAALDAGPGRLVGQRPEPHRALERPVLRAAPESASCTARRSRGSMSGMFSNTRRLRSCRLPHASTSATR